MTTVLEAINTSLHDVMAEDDRVYFLGEDILDPYGGAFKVTRGLSSSFPDRVITTPISEAGIVGIAGGMALRGLRPIVEIMFGDFFTLIADQLINHISKFRWMYNDQVNVPVVIRAPMGGRRGYGPTHSQSLEKLFLGVPGLRVLSPSTIGDPGKLLRQAVLDDDNPVIFVENKLLYLQNLHSEISLKDYDIRTSRGDQTVNKSSVISSYAPTYTLTIAGAPPPSLTLVAYGYMAELALEASSRLAYEDEIFSELVIPTQLSPFEMTPINASVGKTQQLIVVEEGTITLGWGAEILARSAEVFGRNLRSAIRLGGMDLPIPASEQLEEMVLPDIEDIVNAARESR